MKSTKIDDLDISIRCYQLLKNNRITDIKDLTKIKESDLIKFRGFGSFSLKEIKQIMVKHGLSFNAT
jgi:DNA-directed RNA polymerase subunit alpha